MTDDQQPAQVKALSWGVKQSFRGYVEATGGTIETAAGAERAADGGFTFAPAAGNALRLDATGQPEGRGGFLGEVRFQAHGGMLSVRIVDPAVEIGASGATLTVADAGAPTGRVEIARLDLAAMTAGDHGEIVIPTALSMDGSWLLGDHYPPNTPLDPVRLTLAES
ncbi:MAG TPA: HtaA domain-containing protein [Phenylobacterium sp.]